MKRTGTTEDAENEKRASEDILIYLYISLYVASKLFKLSILRW